MRLVSNLSRAFGAAAAMAALALGAQAQTIGCVTGGSGGLIPATGTGGGTFPGTLPTAPSVFTLNVATVPAGATVVTEVKLLGATHTWVGDLQVVLTDPSGANHNLFCRFGNAGGAGFSCNLAGDYVIVPPCTGGLGMPSTCATADTLTPGTYDQHFGAGSLAWPTGTNGINNTRLDAVAAAAGTWTLTVYDWAVGDTGTLTSFDVCFGTAVPVVPAVPTLVGPADLANVFTPVVLSWNADACATSYDVDVDGVVTTGVATNTFTTGPLAAGAHTWRVRSVNGANSSAFSATRTFTSLGALACVSGGAGGPVPAVGTGGTGAVWPTTLPSSPFVSTYNVTLPAGATQIVKVGVNFGTEHTYIGDLQMVLTDPTGGMHNIVHRFNFTGAGFGSGCDLNGAYSFFETAGAALPTTCPASGDIVPGDYNQNFGNWNSGDLGIFNTPLGSIPVASGNWTLTIYDWVGGDSGTLSSWQLCFDSGPAGPVAYCTSGTSTNGCVPSISATVNPNLANNAGCVITCDDVEGQKLGLFFYGVNNTGFSPVAWGAGTSFLCVKGPTQRTPSGSSGGTFGQCDGSLSVNWDAFQAANPGSLGNPFSAGDSIFVQTWYRDPPSPKTTNLSDALEMTVQP